MLSRQGAAHQKRTKGFASVGTCLYGYERGASGAPSAFVGSTCMSLLTVLLPAENHCCYKQSYLVIVAGLVILIVLLVCVPAGEKCQPKRQRKLTLVVINKSTLVRCHFRTENTLFKETNIIVYIIIIISTQV